MVRTKTAMPPHAIPLLLCMNRIRHSHFLCLQFLLLLVLLPHCICIVCIDLQLKTVFPQSWLRGKNPLWHLRIKPASVACQSNAVPAEVHPPPYPSFAVIIINTTGQTQLVNSTGKTPAAPPYAFTFIFYNCIVPVGNLDSLPQGQPAATDLPNLRCILGVLVFP